jgi:hypothetical protein
MCTIGRTSLSAATSGGQSDRERPLQGPSQADDPLRRSAKQLDRARHRTRIHLRPSGSRRKASMTVSDHPTVRRYFFFCRWKLMQCALLFTRLSCQSEDPPPEAIKHCPIPRWRVRQQASSVRPSNVSESTHVDTERGSYTDFVPLLLHGDLGKKFNNRVKKRLFLKSGSPTGQQHSRHSRETWTKNHIEGTS